MLFTPDTISQNTTRLGAMSGTQKDRLIVRMATEIRQLKCQMQALYQNYQLTQAAYAALLDRIMTRMDYIEKLAQGGSGGAQSQQQDSFLGMPWGGMQVIQSTIQTPPQIQGAVSNVDETMDQMDQMMKANDPVFVDTPMRPVAMVSFDEVG